jgi:mono/diheme cytochrome c family protein
MMLWVKRSPAFGLLWLAALLVASFMTGCSVTTTSIKAPPPLLSQPVVDRRLTDEDFAFPAEPPSLKRGKAVFQVHCASCHDGAFWRTPKIVDRLAYATPIDLYLLLSSGKAPDVFYPTAERRAVLSDTHPAYRQSLSRDDRWASLFYARYLAGAGDIQYQSLNGKPLDVASIYGGNCAVCHGKRGFADGPLHSGRASSHELASAKLHTGLFEPPPANFHDYKRMYNRTDAQMFKYIVEGIYPSGMPPWYGRRDKDYHFVFDDRLIWMLVRHERTFAYKNDLEDEIPPVGPLPSRYMPPSETTSSTRPVFTRSNYQQIHEGLATPTATDTTPSGDAHP